MIRAVLRRALPPVFTFLGNAGAFVPAKLLARLYLRAIDPMTRIPVEPPPVAISEGS